jgi:PD-(D/E)XK nuclease superfamily
MDELNPAQREVRDLLGATAAERPTFDAGLGAELSLEMEKALAPIAASRGEDDTLWVSKHFLTQVHGCEARYQAERDGEFTWSTATARGSVAHKAIELGVSWKGEPVPGDLVDEALARLGQDKTKLADWLRTCGDTTRAELRTSAVGHVNAFFECFPPLSAKWRPVLEGSLRVDLFGGRVVLSGRPDLTLGAARGTTAGKVIVDFKTGRFSPHHRDDLRFYALLDTIRLGTPPRLLATHYLDTARTHPETVTVDLLHSALARTIDGVERMVALDAPDATVTKRTGPACRWCPVLEECQEGRTHLAHEPEDFEPLGDDN